MSLSAHGKSISKVEITNISAHGFWLLAEDKEMFLPYDSFPWFKDQTVAAILNVEEPSDGHFYWPDMDVDLTVDIIENPDSFPLVARP
jgi:hypothetical protein